MGFPLMKEWLRKLRHMRILTLIIKVLQGLLSHPVIGNAAPGEETEGVKELEDGVARLVDGHDHNPVVHTTQTVGERKKHTM